jgi:hypothetical protein
MANIHPFKRQINNLVQPTGAGLPTTTVRNLLAGMKDVWCKAWRLATLPQNGGAQYWLQTLH